MHDFHHILLKQIQEHRVYAWPELSRRRAFLHAISQAYREYESELGALRKSLDASSNELVEANTEMRAIFKALPDQFFYLDAQGRILDYHPGNRRHDYLGHESPIAHCFYDVVHPEIAQQFSQAIAKVLATRDLCCFEFCDSDERFHEVRMFPVMQGQVVALVRDISEQKHSEQRISHLAYHDALTGLPNRLLFKDRLEVCISLAKRHETMTAVLFLDVDRFKHINDTLGHSAGDHLLVTIARRLRQALRVNDGNAYDDVASEPTEARTTDEGPPATIARMGGDEFTIILSEVKDVQAVVRIAQRLLRVLGEPLTLRGEEMFATVSIGIAIYPVDGADFETLVKNADAAMYHAKDRGRNNYQLYTESMNAAAVERLMLENGLHRAIEREELEIHYQPQKLITNERLCAFEALLRWKHGEMGFIPPTVFVPLAEESDLILKIGRWVIGEVCRQIRAWKDAGLDPCRVYVNVSGQQFESTSLVADIQDALSRHGLTGSALGVELTETSIVAQPDRAVRMLESLRTLGIKVAIDDFGTGYSSLSYLQDFPIDSLKIDQSFVRAISSTTGNGNLARAIVAMGHSLGLAVIAEGVENEEQLAFLRRAGCDSVQGYLLGTPLPPSDARSALGSDTPKPSLAPLETPATTPIGTPAG